MRYIFTILLVAGLLSGCDSIRNGGNPGYIINGTTIDTYINTGNCVKFYAYGAHQQVCGDFHITAINGAILK